MILGFDVPCTPVVQRTAEAQGVCVKQHKLIYKFVEDIEHFVADVKRELAEEQGVSTNIDILGAAHVAQLFKIKDPRSKIPKMIQVAGARVT